MFRGALAARRCIVPADAFYEWKATPDGKAPYAVARIDGIRRPVRRLAQPGRRNVAHVRDTHDIR